jgi:hypothetical protein
MTSRREGEKGFPPEGVLGPTQDSSKEQTPWMQEAFQLSAVIWDFAPEDIVGYNRI